MVKINWDEYLESKRQYAQYRVTLLLDAIDEGEFTYVELYYYLWHESEHKRIRCERSVKEAEIAQREGRTLTDLELQWTEAYAALRTMYEDGFRAVLQRFVEQGRRTQEEADEQLTDFTSLKSCPEIPIEVDNKYYVTHFGESPWYYCFKSIYIADMYGCTYPPPLEDKKISFEDWQRMTFPVSDAG
jgi:hypothetical protein